MATNLTYTAGVVRVGLKPGLQEKEKGKSARVRRDLINEREEKKANFFS